MIISSLLVLFVLFAAAGGCTQQSEDEKLTFNTPVQFKLTTEPQTAVFFTARGYTGGMGDPVLAEKRRGIRVDGLRVVLAYGAMAAIEESIENEVALPDCVRNEKILVKARVHLEKRTERNMSIVSAPTETIYRAFIDDLLDVVWSGESCD
jgi:hypothetical protein